MGKRNDELKGGGEGEGWNILLEDGQRKLQGRCSAATVRGADSGHEFPWSRSRLRRLGEASGGGGAAVVWVDPLPSPQVGCAGGVSAEVDDRRAARAGRPPGIRPHESRPRWGGAVARRPVAAKLHCSRHAAALCQSRNYRC